MNWYEIELINDETVKQKIEEIKKAFDKIYKLSGRTIDKALFIESMEHKEVAAKTVKIFISPGISILSGNLIKELNGEPCSKPDKHDLNILVGSYQSWAIL